MAKDQKIKVAWKMAEPPVQPRRWVPILGANTPSSLMSFAKDSTLESSLTVTPGTIGFLRAAFAAGLNRFDGWDCSAIASDLRPAAKSAAKIFKRGAAYREALDAEVETSANDSYKVVILPDEAAIEDVVPEDVDYFIVDTEVARLWREQIDAATARKKSPVLELRLSEVEKSLESVAKVIASGPALAPGKVAKWCVVGGGILTDVAAFAAGLTGAKIIFVPTTLLSMADACIGGKTGVNFPPYGKNQVGLFYFPNEVRVWSGWLKTLPPREIAAGGAECLKHAFLSGEAPINSAVYRDLAVCLGKKDITGVAKHLPNVIRLKANIVAEDPAETGRRASLNFGHTLAHALEGEALASEASGRFKGASLGISIGDEQILHGEAVSVGIAYASLLSQTKAGLSESEKSSIIESMRIANCWLDAKTLSVRIGVPSLNSSELWRSLWQRMCGDKKQTVSGNQTADFVLLSSFGQVFRVGEGWTVKVSEEEAAAAWKKLLQLLESN